jgi:hypothetical protein
VVVAAVGNDLVGTLARATVLAGDRSDPVDERNQLGDVVAIASRGTPPLSTTKWCVEPRRARSTGEGPAAALPQAFRSVRPGIDPSSADQPIPENLWRAWDSCAVFLAESR